MGNTQSSPNDDSDEQEATKNELVEWRKFEERGSWSDRNYAETLIDEIVKAKVSFGEIEEIHILLVGPVQSGKSSFINSVASIDKGRIAMPAKVKKGGKSVTKKPFRPKGRLKNFVIFDTMGVEKEHENGFNVRDIMYVVKGNVCPFYTFNPVSPIKEDNPKFNKYPSNKDKMHCMVYVVDANVIGQNNIPEDTRRKIKELQDALDEHDISTIVLLTKIDVLSNDVEKDITNTYRSASVKDAVDIAEDLFGVPKTSIWPIKNYSEEVNRDIGKEILILLALRQMIFFASDFLESSPEESV